MTLYDTLAPVAHGLISLFTRFEREGTEHVPPTGPFVVACNHVLNADIICLAHALYPLHVHYMAKQELFRNKLFANIITQLHAYPVNRQNPGPSVVKHTLQVLKAGGVVGIFPEGHRTAQGGPLKAGAVRMALRAGVPILPARYLGPLRWSALLRRPRVVVRFGPLLRLDAYKGVPVTDELVNRLVDELSDALRHLGDADAQPAEQSAAPAD